MKSIENLILSGNLDKATALLQNLNPSERSGLRWKGHLQGKILLLSGKFTESLTKMEETRASWGDHIGLLCDIANLHYLHGNYSTWNQTILKLESILTEIHQQLSLDNYLKHSLILARLLEEQGRIMESFLKFIELSHHAEKVLPSFLSRILGNMLRLKVQWNLEANFNISELDPTFLSPNWDYLKLKAIPFRSMPSAAAHGLCLAEFHWKENQTSEIHLALFEKTFSRGEYKTLLLDILEHCLRQRRTFPISLRYRSEKINGNDAYEQILLKFAQGKAPHNIESLANLPPLSQLKALALFEKSKLEEHPQFDFFSDETRELWDRFILDTDSREGHQSVFQLYSSLLLLTRESVRLSFSTEIYQFNLISYLAKGQKVSLEDLVQNCWDTELSEKTRAMLTVTIQTINRKIKQHFSAFPFLLMEREQIFLNPSFIIHKKD